MPRERLDPSDKLWVVRDADDLPEECAWVGVLYTKENGDEVWCHHIVDKVDLL